MRQRREREPTQEEKEAAKERRRQREEEQRKLEEEQQKKDDANIEKWRVEGKRIKEELDGIARRIDETVEENEAFREG